MARQGIAVLAFDRVGHEATHSGHPSLTRGEPRNGGPRSALMPVIAGLLVPDRQDGFCPGGRGTHKSSMKWDCLPGTGPPRSNRGL